MRDTAAGTTRGCGPSGACRKNSDLVMNGGLAAAGARRHYRRAIAVCRDSNGSEGHSGKGGAGALAEFIVLYRLVGVLGCAPAASRSGDHRNG